MNDKNEYKERKREGEMIKKSSIKKKNAVEGRDGGNKNGEKKSK